MVAPLRLRMPDRVVRGTVDSMKALIIGLLVLWLVVSFLGVIIEGLFWLLVIGLVLLLVTGLFGWSRLRGGSRRA
jgi:fatty acid desaturase